ncbi:MAG: hypothetical protein ACYSYV_12210 [Planctomycetota bacterium]|jgi:hypothetical protein
MTDLKAQFTQDDLKKQSQSAEGEIDTKPVIAMVYGISDDWMQRKNKACQSQFWG